MVADLPGWQEYLPARSRYSSSSGNLFGPRPRDCRAPPGGIAVAFSGRQDSRCQATRAMEHAVKDEASTRPNSSAADQARVWRAWPPRACWRRSGWRGGGQGADLDCQMGQEQERVSRQRARSAQRRALQGCLSPRLGAGETRGVSGLTRAVAHVALAGGRRSNGHRVTASGGGRQVGATPSRPQERSGGLARGQHLGWPRRRRSPRRLLRKRRTRFWHSKASRRCCIMPSWLPSTDPARTTSCEFRVAEPACVVTAQATSRQRQHREETSPLRLERERLARSAYRNNELVGASPARGPYPAANAAGAPT